MWFITERGDRRFSDFSLIAGPWHLLNSSCRLSPTPNPSLVCTVISTQLTSVKSDSQTFTKQVLFSAVPDADSSWIKECDYVVTSDPRLWRSRIFFLSDIARCSRQTSCERHCLLLKASNHEIFLWAAYSALLHITMHCEIVCITFTCNVKNYSTYHSWRCW